MRPISERSCRERQPTHPRARLVTEVPQTPMGYEAKEIAFQLDAWQVVETGNATIQG